MNQSNFYIYIYSTSISSCLQNGWVPKMGEKLVIKKDDREEASNYDVHALGVFRDEKMVGHMPIELSKSMDYFLQQSAENCIHVEVTGKRKREIELIVQGRYIAYMKDLRTAEFLIFEMNKR